MTDDVRSNDFSRSIRFTPGQDGAGPEHIASKIAQVMGNLSALAKNGENAYHNYRYLTISQVSEALRPLLAEANLAIVPGLTHTEPIVVGDSQKGVTAHVEFTLICGDTGAMLTTPWQGEAFDSQDKAINKAIRAAQKYFLLVTFGISEADEHEADGDPGVTGKRRPRRKPTSNKCPICQATGDSHAPWCQEIDGQRQDTRTRRGASTAAPQPAPTPKPPKPKPNGGNGRTKPATVRAANWTAAAATLAAEEPYYMTNGQVNYYHLTGAAAKAGYPEITDQNLDEVIDALRQYARDQQALAAAEEEEDGYQIPF